MRCVTIGGVMMLELLASIMAEIGSVLGELEEIRRKTWFKIFGVAFIIIVLLIILKSIIH